jgi:alanine racemase
MFPETRMDMVRIGSSSMAYGQAQYLSIFKQKQNRSSSRVITWKSKIMSVKRMKIGVY